MNKDLFQSSVNEIKASEEFKIETVKMVCNTLNNEIKNKHNRGYWFMRGIPVAVCLIMITGIATFAIFHFNQRINQRKVSSTDSPIYIQQVIGNLYFQNNYDTGLCMYDKKQGKVSTLNIKNVYSMTSFEGHLFYTTLDYELYQYDTDIGKSNRIYSFGHSKMSYFPRAFYADQQYVYVESDEYIYRISLSDGKASVITTIDYGTVSNLKVIQNELYFCLESNGAHGGVYKMSLSGGKIEKLCSFEWARNIFQYKDKLIFTADKISTNTNVYSMDMDGSNITQISSSRLLTNAFTVSNHSAYFETSDGFHEYDLDNKVEKKIDVGKVTAIYGVEEGLYCYYPGNSGHLWFYDFLGKKSVNIIGN